MNGIKACFTGRLGKDAELRMVKNGEPPMVAFSAAIDEQQQVAELWQPDDGRAPRVNIQVVDNVVQPIGQIGRQRPRATRNAERGQRTWNRSRDCGRTRSAREAQAPFHDDWREAVAEGRGR